MRLNVRDDSHLAVLQPLPHLVSLLRTQPGQRELREVFALENHPVNEPVAHLRARHLVAVNEEALLEVGSGRARHKALELESRLGVHWLLPLPPDSTKEVQFAAEAGLLLVGVLLDG